MLDIAIARLQVRRTRENAARKAPERYACHGQPHDRDRACQSAGEERHQGVAAGRGATHWRAAGAGGRSGTHLLFA